MNLSPPSRPRWTVPALLVVAVLLLAVADRAFAVLLARFTVPTRAAQWIWEPRDARDASPAAFYAARDFTLDNPPPRAHLLVSGDAEYILYLNGTRIGTGVYRPGAPLDVYEVGPLLQPGGNRLLAEVRSERGTGGFLLSLEAAGEQLARTDESWRIFNHDALGIVRGWLPLSGDFSPPGAGAVSWGMPPLGRWGRPRVGPVRLLLGEMTRGRPVPAVTGQLLPGLDRVPPDRPQPPRRLFDFGREVAGYLRVDVDPAEQRRSGLLYTGMTPPDPREERPASGILLMAGRRSWMDARPRRFRYALVVGPMGSPGTVAAQVQEVEEGAAAGLLAPVAPARGVLGIAPPPLRTPVEDEVWRQLQGVPGVAGRKDL